MSNSELLSAGLSAILGKKILSRSGGRYSIHDLLIKVHHLRDARTLPGCHIQSASTSSPILMKFGGGPGFASPMETFDSDGLDPDFDYDFTDLEDDGKKYMRGGFEFKRPYGWKRYAVKVLGKYEDDKWLGPNGIRTDEAPGEWPVSYHGTNISSAKKILKEGYKPGPRDLYGKGIYSSPSLEIVEKKYAQEFTEEGKTYKIVIQNRVNPDEGNGRLKIFPASQTGVGADYWFSPAYNDDVRPYGILIREVSKSTS